MNKITKRLILYFALLAIAIYLMVTLWSAIHREQGPVLPRDYDEIVASGMLNVVTDYNTLGYRVAGDTVVGFQYELIKAIERDWEIDVNLFLENSLEENLEGLQVGRYDIVARNIPVNTELKGEFGFTRFLNRNKLVLVQRKLEYNDSIEPVRSQLDLAGKTIYVHQDSPAKLRIENLAHEIGDTIFIEEDPLYEAQQLVMMVAGGDIDFTVCGMQLAKSLASKITEIDIETDISFTQLESWAVRKESHALLDSLNAWFEGFMKSPQYNKIYDKYYD